MSADEVAAYAYGVQQAESMWMRILRVLTAWMVNVNIKNKQSPEQILPLPGDHSEAAYALDLSNKLHAMSEEELAQWMSK